MNKTESAFGKNANAQAKAAAKSDLLVRKIAEQERHVRKLQEGLEQSAQKFGENDTKTLKWKEALASAETELNKLNAELDELDKKQSIGQRLQEAGQSISGLGQKITSVGDTMTKYVSAPILGLGAVSVKTAMDFETSMAKVQTIADTTAVPIGDLRESILDLSSDTGIAATDIAESVYNAISAGQSTADAVGFVETASQLAKAGFTDVGNSIDILTTILNSYGLEAKEVTGVSDRLVTVQNRGKTTIAQLSSTMGKVIPTAAAFGVNLDNVSAAYVVLTKNGISTAESTTYFNSMLNELGKSGTKASEIIKKRTGQSFTELMKSGSNVADVLKILKDEADKSNLSLADMFGSAEAGKAALTILSDGGTEFVNSMDAMQSAAGATTTAFETMADTTAAKMQKTLNNIKNTGIEAGSNLLEMLEPGIEAVGKEIEKLSKWYSNLDKETQTSVSKAAVALGVGGPLISVIGKTVDAVGKITTAVGKAISAFSGFGGASVLGPLAAVAGAVGLAAWSIETSKNAHIEGYDEWMAKVEELGKTAENVKQKTAELNKSMGEILQGVTIETQPIKDLQTQLHSCFDENGQLKKGMEETAQVIMEDINAALGTELPTTFSDNMNENLTAIQNVDNAVQGYIASLQKAAIQEAMGADFVEAWQNEATAWEAMQTAASNYESKLAEVTDTQSRLNELQEMFSGVTDWENFGQVLSDGKTTLGEAKAEYEDLLRVQADQNTELQKMEQKYIENAESCAEATAQVETFNKVMSLLEAGKPDEAAKAFAEMSSNVEAAKSELQKGFVPALKKAGKAVEKFLSDPWTLKANAEIDGAEKESRNAKNIMTKILSNVRANVSGVDGSSTAANAAKVTMTAILAGLTATVGGVAGASTAASTAKSLMQSIFDNPLIARINEVTGWASAVQSAWSSMQAWFNSNPLVSYVKEVVQTVREPGWNWSGMFGHKANGGFITHEQLSWVGEGDKPEVIIPLSPSKRGRAMSLYKQTGAILGAGSGGTINNSTTNLGGVSINVYASPTQSADEIADVVSKRIAQQVYSRGAVFA